MITQVLRERRRSVLIAPIVAAALAFTVLVISAQVSSLWSARTVPPQNAVYFIPSTPAINVGPIPSNCRPKIGCTHDGSNR